jgi:hypothetical protein
MTDHKYIASGLRNVYLAGGVNTFLDDEGDMCLRIEAVNQLERRLAEVLLFQAPYLNGEHVTWFRSHLGFTPAQFSDAAGIPEHILLAAEMVPPVRLSEELDERFREYVCDKLGFSEHKGAWLIAPRGAKPYDVKLVFNGGKWEGTVWL